MIPNGWIYEALGNHVFVKHGFAFKSDYFYSEGQYILLTPGNFHEKGGIRLIPEKIKYYIGSIPQEYILSENDLLVVMTEQAPGLLGSAALIPETNKYLHNQRLGLININNRKVIDINFIYFVFNSWLVRRRIEETASGTKVKHTSPSKIHEIIIPIPPLPEQCKIAEILGAWDDAIALLEKLITAKRKLKQGLMQQLLTGKKRFKEFEGKSSFSRSSDYFESKLGELPDDWEIVKLPDALSFQEGPGVQNHQFTQSGVKLLNGSNIQKAELILDNTSRYIAESEAYGRYKHFLVDAGDLVIASSGISVDKFEEKIAFVADKDLPLCMNTSTIRFKTISQRQVNLIYFKYFMMTALFKKQIRRQITGSAQLNFGPTHLNLTLLVLPSIEEQEKIASVLSAADTEISTLEKQLAAYKQQKRGLMQQLLTGKKRLYQDL
jgi:type I restriction enzyme, S subunit